MAYGSQKYLFKRDNYEVRRNTTDEQLDALWEAVGLGGGPGSGIGITGEENTFAELPPAATHSGEYWSVLTTTGIIGFRKFAGLYRSDGANWIYLGNPVAVASDVANVPSGTISATDVQGAVNEIDSDLTAHVGSRGASHATSTTSEAGFMSAADHLKLSGIQAAATANSSDATLLDRANHTGTQASSTITNFNNDVDARVTLQMSAHTGAADPHPGYLTTAEGNAAYALIAHTHVIADVTGLQAALDGKLGTGSEAATVNTINGRISAGTNVTITGSGTAADPYVINASGGGGGGGTTVANGVATVTITGNAIGQFEWTETVAAVGATATSRVWLDLAAATDDDENTVELLDVIAMSAVPDTDTLTITMTFSQLTRGPIKLNWSAIN
jgi:hypothetical protein